MHSKSYHAPSLNIEHRYGLYETLAGDELRLFVDIKLPLLRSLKTKDRGSE